MDRDDITCFLACLVFGVVLLGACFFGRMIRHRLSYRHRSTETTQLVLAVTSMQVTFSAIVLGLMLNSALNRMERLNDLASSLAQRTVRLDDAFVEYGPNAQLAHVAVLNYLRRELNGFSEASAKQMTEAALKQVEAQILRFDTSDEYHLAIKRDALARYGEVIDVRFRLLSEAGGSSNVPFDTTLELWLILTYFVFGLNSETNQFVTLALVSSICGVVAATFVIFDMDTPLAGLISVSREPLTLALAQLR